MPSGGALPPRSALTQHLRCGPRRCGERSRGERSRGDRDPRRPTLGGGSQYATPPRRRCMRRRRTRSRVQGAHQDLHGAPRKVRSFPRAPAARQGTERHCGAALRSQSGGPARGKPAVAGPPEVDCRGVRRRLDLVEPSLPVRAGRSAADGLGPAASRARGAAAGRRASGMKSASPAASVTASPADSSPATESSPATAAPAAPTRRPSVHHAFGPGARSAAPGSRSSAILVLLCRRAAAAAQQRRERWGTKPSILQ